MNSEILNTMVHTGQALITSPAVQGVVSSLITTLSLKQMRNIHCGV